MIIGIHYTKANWSFCHQWIKYCQTNNISHKLVNAYNNNIIEELADCDIFLWHHNHMLHTDTLFAKQLLYSLEMAGKQVFPNFHTSWHFDDKLGQKYLLESIHAPMANSYVFYDWKTTKEWINNASFPKVFKLRGGSGSTNVRLIQSKKEALRITKKILTTGISPYNRMGDLKENYRKYQLKRTSLKNLLKSMFRTILSTHYARKKGREIGYAYFQDYIPNDGYDMRVIVMANRAFAGKRLVRKNDFRASGSGDVIFDKEMLDERCVQIAFDVTKKLQAQSIAYDFVVDKERGPQIVEISYCFTANNYDVHAGYWDEEMNWHEGKFNPLVWIVEDLINS